MAGILPPDHIEYYKQQVDRKTENLRFETTHFIKNFYSLNNHLPFFPWTFVKTLETLRLFSDTIGHKNIMLDNLPLIIEHDLLKTVGTFPSDYVPKYSIDKKTVIGGMLPCKMQFETLQIDANTFYSQMYTFILSHYALTHQLPTLPHSFVIGFKYLQLKKMQTMDPYVVDNIPDKLHAHIIREIGVIPPDNYIPFSTAASRRK